MKSTFASTLTIALFASLVSADQTPEAPGSSKPTQPAARKSTDRSEAQGQPAAGRKTEKKLDSVRKRSDVNEGPASALQPENLQVQKLAVLSEDELNQLLGKRINGAMGMTFGQFGNLYLVKSRLEIGVGIGLMTDDRQIVRSELQSPFPETYHPTLREFLDAIALQTFSEWKYDPTDKHFQSDFEINEPVEGLAIFEFAPAERNKPFTIKLAEDWKTAFTRMWKRCFGHSQ